jgi:hypothetical protein
MAYLKQYTSYPKQTIRKQSSRIQLKYFINLNINYKNEAINQSISNVLLETVLQNFLQPLVFPFPSVLSLQVKNGIQRPQEQPEKAK